MTLLKKIQMEENHI